MTKWQQVKLGDIADFSNGINFDKSSYCKNGTAFIGVSDFGEQLYPDYSTLRHIDNAVVKNCNFLEHGDIVFVRSNGNKALVGRSMLITNPPINTTFSGFCIRARIREQKSFDPLFFAYLFKNENFRKAISGCSIGANIQNLSQGKLASFVAFVPPIEEQRKIADVLSTYDDLIENNRKQIKLLEEAAQRLYKEWFIDLRFPGYESTPIIDGIPEGWEKGSAIDFFNITIGKTPPRAESQCFTNGNSGIPWVSISDMGNSGIYISGTLEGLTPDAVNRYNVKVIPAGTILLSFKLTLGRVSIATAPCCTNEAIAHFYIENEDLRPYTLLYLKSFKYDTLGNTSSISKAVNSSIIKAMPFIMPNADLIVAFAKFTNPIFEKIYHLQKSINEAKSSRDCLLPKLMTGELEVV